MHPLLTARRRLVLYLAAWLPMILLLAFTMAASGTLPWYQAAAAVAPGVTIFAFLCLTPWYVCRARPMRLAMAPALLASHGAAAVVAGALLASMAWLPAAAVPGLETGLRTHLPLLFAGGVLLYLLSVALHYMALAAEAAREAEARQAEARALAREAELQALKAQLNPHFLFNSLNSIRALTMADGARAGEMCVRLAGFLRSSLALGARESIPLRDELALARQYLQVEQVRFGDRMQVREDIEPGCEGCMVPALLLQPLLENAMKHGVAGMTEGGSIRLAASRRGGGVTITVENAFDPDAPAPRASGVGLANVRRRLQVRYGDDAVFEAGALGNFYRVSLRFPCGAAV